MAFTPWLRVRLAGLLQLLLSADRWSGLLLLLPERRVPFAFFGIFSLLLCLMLLFV